MTEEKSPKAPLLVHAAFALLAINSSIALMFCVSPNFGRPSNVNQVPERYDTLADKGSPFQPADIIKARRGFRLPPKLEPIIAQVIPEETIPPTGSGN